MFVIQAAKPTDYGRMIRKFTRALANFLNKGGHRGWTGKKGWSAREGACRPLTTERQARGSIDDVMATAPHAVDVCTLVLFIPTDAGIGAAANTTSCSTDSRATTRVAGYGTDGRAGGRAQ